MASQVGNRGMRQNVLGWASGNHSPVLAEASSYSPRGWPLKAEKLPCGLRLLPLWLAGARVAPGGCTHHTHGAHELLFEEYGLRWPVACWLPVAGCVCRVRLPTGRCPCLSCMWSELHRTGLRFWFSLSPPGQCASEYLPRASRCPRCWGQMISKTGTFSVLS